MESYSQQDSVRSLIKESNLLIPDLLSYINFDEKNLGRFDSDKLSLRYIIAQSIDKAIQDIIPPVISRSVTIAVITTKVVALKDFALEQNHDNFIRGIQKMV